MKRGLCGEEVFFGEKESFDPRKGNLIGKIKLLNRALFFFLAETRGFQCTGGKRKKSGECFSCTPPGMTVLLLKKRDGVGLGWVWVGRERYGLTLLWLSH